MKVQKHTGQALDPFLTVTQIKSLKNNVELPPATGFFYTKEQKLYLITSKHVLQDDTDKKEIVDKIQIKLHLNNDLKNNYDITLNMHDYKLHYPDNDEIDVAVIELTRSFEMYNIHWLSKDNPPLSGIDEGADISVLGYPLGLFDQVNNLPILSSARFASKWRVNYGGKPYFLIQARLLPGTSGSPVIKIAGTMPSEERRDLSKPTESITMFLGIHSHELAVDKNKIQGIKDEMHDFNVVWYWWVLDDILK